MTESSFMSFSRLFIHVLGFTRARLRLCSVFPKDTPRKNPLIAVRIKPNNCRLQVVHFITEPHRIPPLHTKLYPTNLINLDFIITDGESCPNQHYFLLFPLCFFYPNQHDFLLFPHYLQITLIPE